MYNVGTTAIIHKICVIHTGGTTLPCFNKGLQITVIITQSLSILSEHLNLRIEPPQQKDTASGHKPDYIIKLSLGTQLKENLII